MLIYHFIFVYFKKYIKIEYIREEEFVLSRKLNP